MHSDQKKELVLVIVSGAICSTLLLVILRIIIPGICYLNNFEGYISSIEALQLLKTADFVYELFFYICLVLSYIGLALIIVKKSSRYTVFFTSFTVAYLLLLHPFWFLANEVRYHAFHQSAEKLNCVVTAINAYTATNGVPPTRLNLIVPDFINRLPSTGMCAFPNLEYTEDKNSRLLHNNRWTLKISCDLNDSRLALFYLPNQDYFADKDEYPLTYVPIGKWAYRMLYW